MFCKIRLKLAVKSSWFIANTSLAFSKSLESVLKFTWVSLFIVINLVHLLVFYIVTQIDTAGNFQKSRNQLTVPALFILPHRLLDIRQTYPEQV